MLMVLALLIASLMSWIELALRWKLEILPVRIIILLRIECLIPITKLGERALASTIKSTLLARLTLVVGCKIIFYLFLFSCLSQFQNFFMFV